jgi:very-short-patch-repair endonuclease
MRGLRILEIRRARALRSNQTSAEAKLWARLRNRQLNGYKFVRQLPIGVYLVDFCCREINLIIELDGATHSTELEVSHDTNQTAILEKAGYLVLRFQNIEVYNNIHGVLDTLSARIEKRDHV